jgi:hypothetical protein
MAAIPSSTETVLDPGLGVVEPATTTPVFIGTASSGTENSFALYSTKKALTEEFGYGPAVEAALHAMGVAGGPVGFIRASTSIAASNGTVTVTGTSPTPVLSGDAVSDYSCRVEILSAGDLGVATFRYTLDAAPGADVSELTFSGTQTIAGDGITQLGSSGVICTFQAGAHAAGDVITFDIACAASNGTEITAAMNALDATNDPWAFVYVVTSKNTAQGGDDNAAHSTIATGVQSSLNTMAANSKYRAGIIAANRDDSDPLAEWADDVHDRLLIAYGSARMVSGAPSVGHYAPTVSAGNAIAARAAESLISTDLKRVPDGSLDGILSITKDGRTGAGESWDNIKLSSLRTYEGRGGYYVFQGRIKSESGSDFTIWPRRRVMDVACTTVHDIQTNWIGIGVRTNDDGSIDERDARRLEAVMNSALTSQLLSPRNAEGTDGHVSAFRYTIDRTNNVLSTGTVQAELAIRPLANVDYIVTTVGFTVSLGEAA